MANETNSKSSFREWIEKNQKADLFVAGSTLLAAIITALGKNSFLKENISTTLPIPWFDLVTCILHIIFLVLVLYRMGNFSLFSHNKSDALYKYVQESFPNTTISNYEPKVLYKSVITVVRQFYYSWIFIWISWLIMYVNQLIYIFINDKKIIYIVFKAYKNED